MIWYLLKTWMGREEWMVQEIRRTVPPYMYQEVFVIRNERIWRRQGRSIVHTEPLFKGCVFLTCRETEPLFRRMEKIPALSRLTASGYLSVFPLMEKDAAFLEQIAGEDHVVRPSYVIRDEEKERYRVSGPLEECLTDIEGFEFRKRFVKIHKRLWGEDRVIAMGILLREDMDQKLLYGSQEVPLKMPGHFTFLETTIDRSGKRIYAESPVPALPELYKEMTMVG